VLVALALGTVLGGCWLAAVSGPMDLLRHFRPRYGAGWLLAGSGERGGHVQKRDRD